MKKRQVRVLGAALLMILGLAASPVEAQNTGLCLECHAQNVLPDAQLPLPVSRLTEAESVYQTRIHPCPALRSLGEEDFFTASRITRLQEVLQALEKKGWATGPLQRSLHQNAAAFSSLQAEPIRSSSQFTHQTSALRTRLQKIYDRGLQMREETERRWLIGWGSLILLILLIFVGIGYGKMNRIGKLLWLVGLAAGCFTLPACTWGTGEPAKKSPAQEQVDRSLSAARLIAGQVEETFHRSFLLAQTGRQWAAIDLGEAERSFELAWKGALQAKEKSEELQSLESLASRWPDPSSAARDQVNFDSVLDLRDLLRQSRGRTWALRAVAEEWAKADPVRGRQALERVLQGATARKDNEIRDRELRAIADAWTQVDVQVAWEVCRSIQNLLLRSMALKEVGRALGNREKSREALAEAWQTAVKIEAPEERLYAMIRIGATAAAAFPTDEGSWGRRVSEQIQAEKNLQLRAWLTRDLVQAWSALAPGEAERWIGEIPGEFPATRAYALLTLAGEARIPGEKKTSLLQQALTETARVADDYEKKKLKRVVVEAISRLDPEKGMALVPQVQDPDDRSRVLAQIARQEGARAIEKGLSVADIIPTEGLREIVIVELIEQRVVREMDQFRRLGQEGIQASVSIADPYERVLRLIEIGKNGNGADGQIGSGAFRRARKVLEEIPPSWKRTVGSEELVKAWKQINPAGAGEVLREIDPAALRLRAFVADIRLWGTIDPDRAKKMAKEIPASHPLEKARALREAALSLKNSRKAEAWECLQQSLDLIFPLPPEGTGRDKFLGELVGEMARMDGEKTVRVLARIQPVHARDTLLGDATRAFVQVNTREGLQRALTSTARIAEGSLRLSLYRRIADEAVKLQDSIHGDPATGPALLAVSFWGLGREQAKREETEAVPYFAKALGSIQQVEGEKERSFLTNALAADLALIDDAQALQWIDRSPQSFAEPYSHGLLEIGSQLKRWNRGKAEAVLEKALGISAKIEDPYLRIRRTLEIGRRWWEINESKGKELLQTALEEGEKQLPPGSLKDQILEETLLAWCDRDPQSVYAILANVPVPKIRAVVLSAAARKWKKEKLDNDVKRLDGALQFARQEQDDRLQGKVAVAWYALDAGKGSEIVKGIPSSEVRSETWKRIAVRDSGISREEANRLLDLAFQEALKIEAEGERIPVLQGIAAVWAKRDPVRALEIYRKIYQIGEEDFVRSPF